MGVKVKKMVQCNKPCKKGGNYSRFTKSTKSEPVSEPFLNFKGSILAFSYSPL